MPRGYEDRYFECSNDALPLARALYQEMSSLPILSPHGHVNPKLLAENSAFADPVELLISPDHYITRMLASQGITYEELNLPDRSGERTKKIPAEQIWQLLAENWQAFAGTPSRIWFEEILTQIFHIELPFDQENAAEIYRQISRRLEESDFRPQTLFESFNIEILATTDGTSDSLEFHKALEATPLQSKVIPTFRPDDVSDPERADWKEALAKFEQSTNITITSFVSLRQALRTARDRFIRNGAKATDHGVPTPFAIDLSEQAKEELFSELQAKPASPENAELFRGVMLMEHAQMSADDGLVMQIHPGSVRNYSTGIFEKFGPDRGYDIPARTEFTKNLRPLLERFGFAQNFRLALFTLDESTYSRELAPIAGAFPTVKLGPPWWFHDSLNGMRRWRDATIETAGIMNTIGFIDDTRAFLSIPVRHDVARRFDAGYLAELVCSHRMREADAHDLATQIAYHLSKDFFRL